jgi:hypothetical protein
MKLQRVIRVLAISTSLVFAVSTTAVALITPVAIVGGKTAQFRPFGNGTWYAWDSNSVARPKHRDVFAEPVSGGPPVKVNAPGSQGFAGGFDPGTNTVIYQQVSGGRSDIYLYDLDTKQRTVPPGVNSSRWEYRPRISATHILFARERRVRGLSYTTAYLEDRTTHALVELGTTKDKAVGYFPGSLGETYVTYTLAGAKQNIYVYEIGTGTRHKVPLPARSAQYAPAVDESAGTLYFTRSGLGCGANARLLAVPVSNLSATATRLAQLPRGIDLDYNASLAPDPATVNGVDYLFTRYVCKNGGADVYAFPDVNV